MKLVIELRDYAGKESEAIAWLVDFLKGAKEDNGRLSKAAEEEEFSNVIGLLPFYGQNREDMEFWTEAFDKARKIYKKGGSK